MCWTASISGAEAGVNKETTGALKIGEKSGCLKQVYKFCEKPIPIFKALAATTEQQQQHKRHDHPLRRPDPFG
jgi:hypothetical protein